MLDAIIISVVLGIVSVAFICDLLYFTNNINKGK